MDRNIMLLEQQLHRLNREELPIDPVTDSDGLPQSFDDWCTAMMTFYRYQPCPSRVSQLIVTSIQEEVGVAEVVEMMQGRFRQRDVRYQTIADEDVAVAIKDLALAVRTHRVLPERIDIGQARYTTMHFLAKYEDSDIKIPTNLIVTMQMAGIQLQAREWSVGLLIGLIRQAARSAA